MTPKKLFINASVAEKAAAKDDASDERARAYMTYLGMKSAYFWSWTGKAAAFKDKREAALFKDMFPDYKVN